MLKQCLRHIQIFLDRVKDCSAVLLSFPVLFTFATLIFIDQEISVKDNFICLKKGLYLL